MRCQKIQYRIIQQRENRDMWSMLYRIITTGLLRSRGEKALDLCGLQNV